MTIKVPAGSVIRQDADGYYAVLPDGTHKRISIVIKNGLPHLIATRVTKQGKVEIEEEAQ